MANGISVTSSINKTPPDAFSKEPYNIEPSFFSSPNNSVSYFFKSNNAPFKIIKGEFFLLDFLCIFLAINSLPEPVGPVINTLLSESDNFCICSFIRKIFWLFPINSKE